MNDSHEQSSEAALASGKCACSTCFLDEALGLVGVSLVIGIVVLLFTL